MKNQVTEAETQIVNKYIKTSPWLVKRGCKFGKEKSLFGIHSICSFKSLITSITVEHGANV